MLNAVVTDRIIKAEDGSENVAIMMVEAGGGKNQ